MWQRIIFMLSIDHYSHLCLHMGVQIIWTCTLRLIPNRKNTAPSQPGRLLMSKLIVVCCESERDDFKHALILKSNFKLGNMNAAALLFYLVLVAFLGDPLHLKPQLLFLDSKGFTFFLLLLLFPALLLPLLFMLLLHLCHIWFNNAQFKCLKKTTKWKVCQPERVSPASVPSSGPLLAPSPGVWVPSPTRAPW